MDEDRESDKKHKFAPMRETRKASQMISLDAIKSAYIAEGLNATEIADRYFLSPEVVSKLIQEHKLPELRKAYIQEGIAKIQNVQLHQAQSIMDIELKFKKLKLVQLTAQLEDYMAYYARHGHLYKVHPATGEILKTVDGIPLQLDVPNVSKEIYQLKESLTLSEGVKKLMVDLNSIINGDNKNTESVTDDEEIIEMSEIEGLFTKSSK